MTLSGQSYPYNASFVTGWKIWIKTHDIALEMLLMYDFTHSQASVLQRMQHCAVTLNSMTFLFFMVIFKIIASFV